MSTDETMIEEMREGIRLMRLRNDRLQDALMLIMETSISASGLPDEKLKEKIKTIYELADFAINGEGKHVF